MDKIKAVMSGYPNPTEERPLASYAAKTPRKIDPSYAYDRNKISSRNYTAASKNSSFSSNTYSKYGMAKTGK